jgi:hypothetical protein
MAARYTIDREQPFFIFDSRGEAHALKLRDYVYDLRGEYIGYVRGGDYDVFTAGGEWIGALVPDGRIVRKRTGGRRPLDANRPAPQPRIRVTARIPLAPMSADLGFDQIDVLEWDEDIFKRISDLTPDLD